MSRLDWIPIIERAKVIVSSYDGGVTLRQLFYRLVSESLIPNTQGAYTYLSNKTAKARRSGTFPPLVDHTRSIGEVASWQSPGDAIDDLASFYRLDRTAHQDYALYLGAEKATMKSLLERWFQPLGFPIVLLRGYGSQTYLDKIRSHALRDPRPAVIIYAGDLDPSGEDIERDFEERTNCWHNFERIAVTNEQVIGFGLTKQPGKVDDTRSDGFVKRYGSLFQVEVEAIAPEVLQELYEDAIDKYWDIDKYEKVLKQEQNHKKRIKSLVNTV